MKTGITNGRKAKILTINKIAKEYKKIKFLMKENFLVCEEENGYMEGAKDFKYYEDLKKKVEFILMQMEDKLAKIMYNDFFTNNKSGWWMYNYSTSTYYRLKNKAIDSFWEWWYA